MDYHDVIHFWFEELSPAQWWHKDDKLDTVIRDKFLTIHQQAAKGELSDWRSDAKGCLAEVIILDQFSRNMFRGSALSFAFDGMALVLAQEAIRRKINEQLPCTQRVFLYLPFMHSESARIHKQATILFSEPGLEDNLSFEKKHAAIIRRFGRYPHRNSVLGRQSTEEELQFMRHHSGF